MVSNGPDLDTIEGVLLESYLDQYNLNVQWIDEQGFWGSKSDDGTFNGVVGRVSYYIEKLSDLTNLIMSNRQSYNPRMIRII